MDSYPKSPIDCWNDSTKDSSQNSVQIRHFVESQNYLLKMQFLHRQIDPFQGNFCVIYRFNDELTAMFSKKELQVFAHSACDSSSILCLLKFNSLQLYIWTSRHFLAAIILHRICKKHHRLASRLLTLVGPLYLTSYCVPATVNDAST